MNKGKETKIKDCNFQDMLSKLHTLAMTHPNGPYPSSLAHQKIAQLQSLAISVMTEPNRRNSCETTGFGLGNRSSRSQIASDFLSHPQITMKHCFVLSLT